MRGRFALIDCGAHGVLPTIDTGHEVMVLDPRAIVRDRAGVVYDPAKMPLEWLAPWVREWLRENAA